MTQSIQVSKRLTLVELPEYQVDLEYNEYFAILHLPFVKKFTKDVYLALREKMEELAIFFKVLGYENVWAAVPEGDTLIQKFLTRLKFEQLGTANSMVVYGYKGDA